LSKTEIFFDDLDASCAQLVQMALMGQNLEALAEKMGCSVSYLYQCTYPDRPQIPNLKKFLLMLREAPQKKRILRLLAQALDLDLLDIAARLRELADQLDGNGEF